MALLAAEQRRRKRMVVAARSLPVDAYGLACRHTLLRPTQAASPGRRFCSAPRLLGCYLQLAIEESAAEMPFSEKV